MGRTAAEAASGVREYTLRTPDGAEVVVASGRIAGASTRTALTVEVGPGELRPGLINAHDHLQLNHYPRLGDPPYQDAYEWGHDIHSRHAERIRRAATLPRAEALLFGALKNLLGGVTAVVHHDPWDDAFDGPFPVRVIPVRVAHSLGFERDLRAARDGDGRTRGRPFSIHVAEGTGPAAAEEIRELDRRGFLDRDLLAVHVVGADAEGARLLRDAGAAVIWCPTSNRFLLGGTAPPELFASGIDILLGTDSLLTADGTMLEEVREAVRLAFLPEPLLERSVGTDAARRLGLREPSLAAGAPADLLLLRRPLGEAAPRDVGLVTVRGVPQLGDVQFTDLFAHCGVETEPLSVGGVQKLVRAPLATVARHAVELTPEAARIFA